MIIHQSSLNSYNAPSKDRISEQEYQFGVVFIIWTNYI